VPNVDYESLKAYAKKIGTYYYGDSSGNIHNANGAVVSFQSEWKNKTGLYFVDTKDQTAPRTGATSNLVSLSMSGAFFTRASLYVGGSIRFTGAGGGTSIQAKNPGELRRDFGGGFATANGRYDCAKNSDGTYDEWTSTDPRGCKVHHANRIEDPTNPNKTWPAEPYFDANGNGLYDYGEWFIDYDGGGMCNVEEWVQDMDANATRTTPYDDGSYTPSQTLRFGAFGSPGTTTSVHIVGFVACAGQFDSGGNCIIYGTVIAQGGFAAGGTPDLYYNCDMRNLKYALSVSGGGSDSPTNYNIAPMSWEILNQ